MIPFGVIFRPGASLYEQVITPLRRRSFADNFVPAILSPL
jgi:hypothetical protein